MCIRNRETFTFKDSVFRAIVCLMSGPMMNTHWPIYIPCSLYFDAIDDVPMSDLTLHTVGR